MAKVTGPNIIERRRNTQGNPWAWVLKINKELNINRIEEDGSIFISLPGDIDMIVLDEVIKIYEDEGWTVGNTVVGSDVVLRFSA